MLQDLQAIEALAIRMKIMKITERAKEQAGSPSS